MVSWWRKQLYLYKTYVSSWSCLVGGTIEWALGWYGRVWAQNTKHSIWSVIKIFKIMREVLRLGSFNCWTEQSWNTWHYISQLIGSDRPMLFFAYLKIKGLQLFSFWSWIFKVTLPQIHLDLSSLAGRYEEWR